MQRATVEMTEITISVVNHPWKEMKDLKRKTLFSPVAKFFRFVNMVSLSELSYETLWNITRNLKLNYIIQNIHTLSSKVCFSLNNEGNVLDQYIETRVDSIEKELILAGSQHINHDINKVLTFETELYERAAKMFIYLNLCPKFMFDWTQLYTNLLQNSPLDMIIQTANRILVTAY